MYKFMNLKQDKTISSRLKKILEERWRGATQIIVSIQLLCQALIFHFVTLSYHNN